MTNKQPGMQQGGTGMDEAATSGPTGPLPKRRQSMDEFGTLIKHDNPDDVETGAQSNPEIERS